MASSDITVATLTVVPTLRGNKCAWTYTDPRANALPNIGLDMVEVHASTTNDRTTAMKVGEGITDFPHDGLVEEQTYYYWIKARDYLGAFGAWYPSGSTAGVAAKAIGIAGLAFAVANGKIAGDINSTDATVATNALRISFKTAAGNDASTADPAYIAFPSATLSDGKPTIVAVTGALALTLSPGSDMGSGGTLAFRLYVAVFNDAGTPRLALKSCSDSGSTLYPLTETGIDSAVAEGGAGGADGRGVFYASQTITSKPYRVIGFVEWINAPGIAGNWNIAPDICRLLKSSAELPGAEVQAYISPFFSAASTTTSIIPLDNSRPLFNEGLSLASITFTPQSACNIIELDFLISISHSVAGAVICSVFRDASGTDEAITANWTNVSAANGVAQLALRERIFTNLATATVFTVRIGPAVAGTLTINGISGSSSLGQLVKSSLRIREIRA